MYSYREARWLRLRWEFSCRTHTHTRYMQNTENTHPPGLKYTYNKFGIFPSEGGVLLLKTAKEQVNS